MDLTDNQGNRVYFKTADAAGAVLRAHGFIPFGGTGSWTKWDELFGWCEADIRFNGAGYFVQMTIRN